MRILHCLVLIGLAGVLFSRCGSTSTSASETTFTKADSLTEYYLSLQDSMHRAWNMMINDENTKIEAMHHLLHELTVSNPGEITRLSSLQERLDQLVRMRFTQKSMQNHDVIAEYDLATRSISDDLLVTAQEKKEFSYNKTLQKLVLNIEEAEYRAVSYRVQYDSIVKAYNLFIDQNERYLRQTDESLSLERRPLFYPVSNR